MLGRGGRPPPCLLWFVARLNESENKSSEGGFEKQSLTEPSRPCWLDGRLLSLGGVAVGGGVGPGVHRVVARVEPRVIRLLGLHPTVASQLHQQAPTRSNSMQSTMQQRVRDTNLGECQITDRLVHQQIGHHWKVGREMRYWKVLELT